MISEFNIDCLIKIFETLENDHKSLHSCVLVNKLWCQYAIPKLWKSPWRNGERVSSQVSLIKTYISAFPKESKEILIENGFESSSIESNKSQRQIFNYMSFLRNLQIYHLESSIRHWLIETLNNKSISEYNKLSEYKSRLLIKEFFKFIFTQSPNLYVLNASSTYRNYDLLTDAIENIPQAKTCLSMLTRFKCYKTISIEMKLYPAISKICHNIKRLHVGQVEISKDLILLINSQKDLKEIIIEKHFGMKLNNNPPSLNSKENEICSLNLKKSSSITYLEFKAIYFNIQLLPKFENLRELKVKANGSGIYSKEQLEPLLNVSLKKLEVFYWECKHSIYLEIFSKFFLLNGQNLRKITIGARLFIDVNNSGLLLNSIAITCLNLQYYEGPIMEDNIIEFRKLLELCKNLKILRLCPSREDRKSLWVIPKQIYFDDLLDVITFVSPRSLTELRLVDTWTISLEPFKNFLLSRKLLEIPIEFYCNPSIIILTKFEEICNEYQSILKFDINEYKLK
ncbi:hypothetical protein RclHR1_00200046 [Rhizophagus clarus]|uniref:F-box domain-containing protein n=1 Tax=Rhizophagus clarus TaxID=94130 RepID=A0A2Z6QPT1_9GLOM|nr:hypothetical protein RclHR1_00200046 [Rhizophagus clarus]GES99459.1 hypothetical protein GLOIN_2v1546886 [Rhizophagus clarus]